MAPLLLLLAAAPPDTLTLAEARALSVGALAQRVLGMAGTDMHEAKLINGGPPIGSPEQLRSIEFSAGGGYSSGPGLCEVQIVSVGFYPVRRNDPARDPVSRAGRLATYPLYAVLPLASAPRPTDYLAVARADAHACARLGPALADKTVFFRATWDHRRDLQSNEATFLVELLRRLDTRGRLSQPAVTCEDSEVDGCPDAIKALARIEALKPVTADVAPCPAAPTRLCATLEYDRVGLMSVAGNFTQVTVETDAATLFASDYHILTIKLDRRGWVV